MSEKYSKIAINVFAALAIALFGVAEIAVIYYAFPEHYTNYMLFIPAYFLVLSVSTLIFLLRFVHDRLHPRRAVARFMLVDSAQFMLSVAILFFYVYFLDTREGHKNALLWAFVIYYIWFMVIKTVVLYNIDNHQRKQRLRDEEGKNK